MSVFFGFCIAFCLVFMAFLIYFLSKHKFPIKYFFFQAVISFIVFMIINLTSFATGYYIPLNYGTTIGTAAGGVPFIVLWFALKTIFLL